jgi:hypothetical protein
MYGAEQQAGNPHHWRWHDRSWWYTAFPEAELWAPMIYSHSAGWSESGRARRLPAFPVHDGIERDSPWADHPAGSVGASPAAWTLLDGIWHFNVNAGTGAVPRWSPYTLTGGEWLPITAERRTPAVTPPDDWSVSDVLGG